jgi:hypothetical protein
MMTFAYAVIPFSRFQGKSGTFTIKDFRKTTSVSDLILPGLLEQPPGPPFPFKLQMSVAFQHSEIPVAIRHYCEPGPLLAFTHELVIRPVTLSLTILKKLKQTPASAFLLEFQLRNGKTILPVFAGENSGFTRCQSQPNQLFFHEELRIQLPTQLDSNWGLHVNVLKSVTGQSDVKSVASGLLKLFDGKTFVTDGNHDIQLIVPKQRSNPEENVVIETYLRSSLCSCDPNISAILRGELIAIPSIPRPILLPHLFLVLDAIIDGLPEIEVKGPLAHRLMDSKGFCMLIDIVKQFPEDPLVSEDSQALLAYIKFCALRKPRKTPFHSTLLILWMNYLGQSPIDSNQLEFGRIWFFFELIVKSATIHKFDDWVSLAMVTSTLVKGLSAFRSREEKLGSVASRSLACFYTDCFEFGNPSEVFRLVAEHISFFDFSFSLDRESFTELIYAFFSPKVFIWTVLPPQNGPSVFDSVFLPRFEESLTIPNYPEQVFHALLDVILQFTPLEHKSFAPHLLKLVNIIGTISDDNPIQQSEIHFFLIIIHFILYYTPFQSIEPDFARILGRLVRFSEPLVEDEQFCSKLSFPGNSPTALYTFDSEPDYDKHLYHCLLAVLCQLVVNVQTPSVMNSLVVKLCNAQIPQVLEPYLNQAILGNLETHAKLLLDSEDSKIASVFVWALSNPNQNRIHLINRIFELETQFFKTNNRSVALFSRALFKHPPKQATLEILSQTPLSDLVNSLFVISTKLQAPELRENFDAYSNLLLQKADLLSRSPDARVALLLELSNYHRAQKYNTESVVAMLTAATLIAENLDQLNRIPDIFKCKGKIIDFFASVCPSVVSERTPASVLADLPKLRGYATSQYFSEYGILWFLRSTAQTLKLAELYELNVKIMQLFTIIAEYRLIWRSVVQLYQTNMMLWKVIQEASKRNNRNLGSFWYIQFPDRRSFIYRFVGLVELNALSERLSKEFQYHSDGKPVIVTNKGSELPEELPDDNYLVLLRAVQPHFSLYETQRRATAFLRAFGVDEFFFEIPEVVNGVNATRRTIITLHVPMPFIVSRVEFKRENVRSEIVMPIQKACEDLEGKTNEIKGYMRCDDYANIQRLVHGVLLAGCNGGPGQYVTEFLGPLASESEFQGQLRRALRDLLAVVQAGIAVLKNPGSGLKLSTIEAYEELLNELTSVWQVSLG